MLWRMFLASLIMAISLTLAVGAATDAPLVALQAVVGEPCHIRLATTQAGAALSATVDFGDGGDRRHYSEGDLESMAPYLQHTYQRTGRFTVWANISGIATWRTSSSKVLVVAPSGAVRLHCLAEDAVVPVLRPVMALASVSAGKEPVTFDWDFGDGTGNLWTTVLSSNGTSSLASHKYGIAGSYPVRVVASGSAFATPVAVELPALLQVVEPIRDVHLRPFLGSFGAPLKRCVNGSYCTDKVVFEARTDQGSQVDFGFDFGDGTLTKVAAMLDFIMNVPNGRAAHSYWQVGSYKVCVTASNPLGSRMQCLTQPFSVQMPPEGLRLSEAHYIAQAGKVIGLKVVLAAGTNVSFDWQIADERRFDAGPEISHVFATTGNFKVVVTAYNNVTDLAFEKLVRPSATADVAVRNALQEVQLEIVNHVPTSTRDWVVSTKDSVEFVAHVQPPPGGGEVYLWSWGDQVGRKRRTLTNKMTQTFHEHGRYSLLVTVANYVSNVSSPPVGLRVVQQLEQLRRVQHPPSILRGRSVPFEALFWYGSDLTYTWDFGDGRATRNTTEQPTYHAFERVGEFVVTVKLSNVLGSGQLNATVFVLDEVCHQPLVRLLGIWDNITVYRGEDVRAEADVEAQCAASKGVSYFWTVSAPGASCRSERRLLLMPTDKMAAGSYVVHLRVAMNGTIVYADVLSSLRLADPPLEAQIAGSSIRSVSRSDDVILIGSTNKNGAGRSESNVVTSFQWRCVSSTNPKSDCFPNSKLIWNQPELHFAAALLDAQLTQFLFTFRVRRGAENATASQVLQLTAAPKVLHVNLFCTSCHDRVFVSKHDRVAISVDCAECATSTKFEWQLWLVLDGNENLPISQQDCVQPDGSTFYLVANSSDVARNATNTRPSFNATYFEDDAFTMPGPLAPKSKKRQRKPATNVPTEEPSRASHVLPETLEATNHSEPGGSHELRQMHESHGRITEDVNITEGFAGEAGSAAARDLATSLAKKPRKIRGQAGQKARPVGMALVSGLERSRTSKMRRVKVDGFATKQWLSMHLLEEETVTGLNTDKLVIKPDVLKPGRTYVVILDVQDSVNAHLQGRTMQEIRMHSGPLNGRCLLHPSSGYEYSTVFKLDCLEWRGMNPNRPLFYELRYTLRDSEDSGILVRYGLDNNFKFVLPAGLRENGHSVYLNVAVHQRFGGQTDVCALSVKVQPLSHHPSISAEEIIDEELNKPTSSLLLALGKDDLSQALNRIQVVASVLNSRNDMEKGNFGAGTGEVLNPYKVRQVLLSWISALNISAEEEALQMLEAVNSIMETEDQVELSSLETVSRVVHFAGMLLASRDRRFAIGLSYYRTSMTILNSLLKGLASISSNNSISCAVLSPLFDSCRDALRLSVTHRLGYQVLGEPPLRFSSKFFTLEATCLAPSSVPCSYLSEGINLLFRPLDCLCVELIMFDDYITLDSENTTKSTLPVVTTNFMHCNGSQFHPNELQLASPVSVDIPTTSRRTKNASIFGTFYQHSMEVYTFVLSGNVSNQNLIIRVQFEEDFQSLLPILLLVSSSDLPCMDDCILRRKFNPGATDLIVTIAGDEFSSGPNYNFGIVRADYGTGDLKRPSKSPKISVNYTLDITFIECVQWNVNETAWSSDGCSVRFSDTSAGRDIISCKCDKLTDYSAWVHSFPCLHRRIDTSSLFKKSVNPVVPAVLVAVVVIFAALIFGSLQISLGRVHVCDPVWLKDNSRCDNHAYLITVQTGYEAGSGTSSTVFIVLHGENGASEPRELYEEARHLIFNRGARNSFFVTTPSNLGPLWKVQIWHSCSGHNPSWFLGHVIIQDLSTGSRYYFKCEKWLSVEEIDGKVETELLVSEKPLTFFQRFWSKFWQLFTKLDIWSSLYQRPPCDHFLQFERVLLCLVNSTASLAFAALWCHWWDLVFETHFQLHVLPSVEFLKAGAVISFLGFLLQIVPALVLQCTKLQSCKKRISISSTLKSSTNALENCLDATSHARQNLPNDEPFVFWKPVQDWAQKQWSENVSDVGSLLANLEKEVLPPRCSPASDLSGASSSGYEDYACRSNEEWRWNKDLYSTSLNCLEPSCCAFLQHVLPGWFRYIIWFFCVAGIVGCVATVLWIAARFSMTTCLIWMLLTMTSIAIASCVVFPILVAAFALPFALTSNSKTPESNCICKSKCRDDFKDEISKFCGSESRERHAADLEAKKRLRFLRYAQPPKESELQEVQKRSIVGKAVSSFLRNTLAVAFIFAILLLLVFGSADTVVHPMNRVLLKQFEWQKSLTQVRNETQVLSWMMTSLIPSLYSSVEEGHVVSGGQTEFWYVGQTSSVLVGKPRLYQSIGRQMQVDVVQSSTIDDDRLLPYQNSTSIDLPRNRNEVRQLLEDLKIMRWLHENCTFVDITFSLYSVPSAFLSEIRVRVNFPPAGKPHTSVEINSVRLWEPVWLTSAMLAFSKVMLLLLLIWNFRCFLECRLLHTDSFFSISEAVKILFAAILLVYVICTFHLSCLTSELVNLLEGSRYLVNVDIVSVLAWNKICNGALGLLFILHTGRCLLHFRHSSSISKMESFTNSGSKAALVVIGPLCLLLVIYNYLTLVWQLNEKGRGSPMAASFYLMSLITRNLKIGCTFQRDPVFASIYFGSLLVLIICTFACGVKATLNSWPPYLNRSITFGLKDVFLTLKTNAVNCLSFNPESQKDTMPDDLPIEILHGELESQVEEMLFRVDQLCRYDGLRFNDDFGCSKSPYCNLNTSSEEEEDVLHFAMSGDFEDGKLSLSTEKPAWPDFFLAKDLDSDENSSSDLSGEFVDDQDVRKPRRNVARPHIPQAVISSWPFEAVVTTLSAHKQEMDSGLSRIFQKSKFLGIPESCSSSDESPPPSRSRKDHRTKTLAKKLSRNDKRSKAADCKDFLEIRDGHSRIDKGSRNAAEAFESGISARGLQASTRKGRIHRTKTQGKELFRKRREFSTVEVGLDEDLEGNKMPMEVALETFPLWHQRSSDTEESQL